MQRAERRQAEHDGRAVRTLSEADYLLGVSDETRLGALRFRWLGKKVFQGRWCRNGRACRLRGLRDKALGLLHYRRLEFQCPPGGQPIDADGTIEMMLTLGMVQHLPLRQTEDVARSLWSLMDRKLGVARHGTLGRRRKTA